MKSINQKKNKQRYNWFVDKWIWKKYGQSQTIKKKNHKCKFMSFLPLFIILACKVLRFINFWAYCCNMQCWCWMIFVLPCKNIIEAFGSKFLIWIRQEHSRSFFVTFQPFADHIMETLFSCTPDIDEMSELKLNNCFACKDRSEMQKYLKS